ncbi:hypothetical protein CBR_g78820 [Chara braunii]|uniref:Uncharacterized protein n=1 Tax=Chara braunii TaxID=69332 RepID=A0A388KAI4_CHABU|nr:hypothetical protein CBR_g78820 [Chara braunii]|eukprot:GBG67039.1 hypothetical protein CBR_g78820 [Chara braunii]
MGQERRLHLRDGVFFYLVEDSWANSSTISNYHAQSVRGGDLRGICSSGDAQANSSVLTLQWMSENLNGTAASAPSRKVGSETALPYLVAFDLSRNERYLVMLSDRGLAFVSTTDGSTTSYEFPDFNVNTGGLNPNRTIFYVGRDGCLECAVMDGESPGSFDNDFRTRACRDGAELGRELTPSVTKAFSKTGATYTLETKLSLRF